MKSKFLILFTSILFISNHSLSQTTQEEYNFITKGYLVQLESGLDMKKGYSLVDLGAWGLNKGDEQRNCEFKALFKQGQNKPCAVMMIYKRTDISNGAAYYLCIPSSDAPSEIWQQTLTFINTYFKDNESLTNTVIWALMKLSSQEISK